MYTVTFTSLFLDGATVGTAQAATLGEAIEMADACEKEGYFVAILLNGQTIYPAPEPRPVRTALAVTEARALYQADKALDTFDGSEGR